MKVMLQKIVYIDEEVELIDFIDNPDCEPEFIDLTSEFYKNSYDFDGYPKQSFIMVHQEIYDGLRELGYILCEEEPENMIEYIKEHISEFVPFDW